MNEQIKKLTQQALENCLFEETKPCIMAKSLNGYGIVEIPLIFSEKFAELIVQDCLDAIVASKYRPSDEKDLLMFQAGLFTAIDAIKQRFGYK